MIEHEEPDGLASTAQHWIGVYTQLARFAAEAARAQDPMSSSAGRVEMHRVELEARLRFWQRELAAILERQESGIA